MTVRPCFPAYQLNAALHNTSCTAQYKGTQVVKAARARGHLRALASDVLKRGP